MILLPALAHFLLGPKRRPSIARALPSRSILGRRDSEEMLQ